MIFPDHPFTLSSVSSPYPFMKLAMDIIGPLPPTSDERKFILAIINYYSKWLEADVFTQVKEKDVENFVWKEVIRSFRISKEIMVDNGTQF